MPHQDPARVVLAIADKQAQRRMARLTEEAGLAAVAVVSDGRAALTAIEQWLPDIVVADMVMPGLDGLALLEGIKASRLFTMPTVILLSFAGMEVFVDQALRLGAHRVLTKPVSERVLKDAFASADLRGRLPRGEAEETWVGGQLSALGLPAISQGTAYLNAAIRFAAADARLLRALTGELYPLVGREFGVDGVCVERKMRRAIETAWSRGALEAQHALFGNTMDARRGKPTCGEMIARMAEMLRTKEMG